MARKKSTPINASSLELRTASDTAKRRTTSADKIARNQRRKMRRKHKRNKPKQTWTTITTWNLHGNSIRERKKTNSEV